MTGTPIATADHGATADTAPIALLHTAIAEAIARLPFAAGPEPLEAAMRGLSDRVDPVQQQLAACEAADRTGALATAQGWLVSAFTHARDKDVVATRAALITAHTLLFRLLPAPAEH